MARPVVYHWKAANLSAVCALQGVAGAGNLVINGEEANLAPVGFSRKVEFPGVLRTVSISSFIDISASEFTITGKYGNKIVSEKKYGPNGSLFPLETTVYTTQLFSEITSVSVDRTTLSVRVGSGNEGQTNWFNFNYHSATHPLLTATVSNVVGTVNLTAKTTLDDVNANETPNLFDGIVLSSATANSFGSCDIPITYATVKADNTTTGSFTVTFLQQGIT